MSATSTSSWTNRARCWAASISSFVADGSAELGYRIGEHAAGRGVATAAVREVCRQAAGTYGLHPLTAATALDNRASTTVLTRDGFVPVGVTTVAGLPGIGYRRDLTTEQTRHLVHSNK
ncbi:GNAT family N-acetyltransferase [Streptomyces spiralis]|uniref:GNAT family N-acetyltransferase n=1 Tax=Streptomyces spiralis TaxID=66376 RepID=UPI0036C0DEE4